MTNHLIDNGDWTEDWQGTSYVFPAVMRRIEQNKLAIKESHEQSHARQVMREQRGREYRDLLVEMQTMTDPRKVALVPTTATNPRQHQTDALDISMMPTMLIPVVRVPQKAATTDELAMIPKRTGPLRDLVDFYKDGGKWHYVNKTIDAAHLLESAIDGYTQHHNTVPAQALHISSVCMLLLAVAQKVTATSRDGKSGIYEDERGSFVVRSDAFVDVDTVVFE
jgi:hypothetical protein